ncbi:MAG TPA: hypothetical protein VL426_06325 [Candidatus Binatia bacterium]|jgi:hypothetical protein|nr:hypothetical protein [Candidatus Binatia bacterium]
MGPGPSASDIGCTPHERIIELATEDIVAEEAGFDIVVGEPIDAPNIVVDRRHELELVIAAYAADEPIPAAAVPCLEVAVTNALVDLGREACPEKVRVVSGRCLLQFAAQLPHAPAALTRLEAGAAAMLLGQLVETVGDAVSDVLGARLADAIGHDACVDLAGIIARRIIAPLIGRPRSFLADQFGERLWRSYHDLLRIHIGSTLAGREKDAALVAPFLEMFRDGNFPVGTLSDGTFLVVTA